MLSEKSRSSLFQNLSPIVGEEAVGEMLAHFPVTEGERPVTKDHVDARLGELGGDMAEMRGELREDIGRLRIEMSEFRVEFHEETKRLMIWLPGSIAAICAAIAFITRLTL
jgi:hypothetical protein